VPEGALAEIFKSFLMISFDTGSFVNARTDFREVMASSAVKVSIFKPFY
jgi:hypothetical protein